MNSIRKPVVVVATDADITMVCKCGAEFIFSAAEQKFFESKGFQEPQRCKKCRTDRKEKRQHEQALARKCRTADMKASLGNVIMRNLVGDS